VNEREESLAFYTRLLGFAHEGERGPFSIVRVSEDFTLQLAPWRTEGGEHLAFAMSRAEFEAAFRRVRDAGVAYGDSFQTIGSGKGPGDEEGARGMGKALYVFDPSRHLIELRHYEL
jgi:catechol 2,3-dioxygenase-like lactoylglutathione lyase family enzyme